MNKETINDIDERVQWCSTFFGCGYGELTNEYWKDLLDAHIRHIHELNDPNEIRSYINEMTHPKWLPVPGYYADVLSNATTVRNTIDRKEYKLCKNWQGYIIFNCRIPKSGRRLTIGVHRAMALACVPNDDPVNKTQVNHIDGIKVNNLPWNLEWVTPSGNIQHAFRTGLKEARKGEEHMMAKYTNEQVHHVCHLLQDCPEMTIEKVAEMTGVNWETVESIYKKRGWTHISKDYTFQDRIPTLSGENNPASVYTEEQVKHVCELLRDRPDLTYKDISKLTGVSSYCIGKIYTNKAWTHISKDYNFEQRSIRNKQR